MKNEILWSDISPEAMKFFRQAGICVPFRKNDVIYRAGERVSAVFLVVSGTIELFEKDGNGPCPVKTAGPGAVVGEISSFTLRSFPYLARAAGPGLLFRLDKQAILELQKVSPADVPQIFLNIIRLMSYGARVCPECGVLAV